MSFRWHRSLSCDLVTTQEERVAAAPQEYQKGGLRFIRHGGVWIGCSKQSTISQEAS